MDITAIVPCYNGAKFINTALDSIAAQSIPVKEIIFIDDGSVDESLNTLKLWKSKNSKIAVKTIQQQQQGVSAARNAGWKASNSEWIAFLDVDDYWYPNHNEVLSNMCRSEPECIFAFCDADQYGEKMPLARCFDQERLKNEISENPQGTVYPIGGTLYRHLLTGSFIPTCSTLIKRQALEEINGFEVGRRFGEDRQLWLKLFTKGKIIASKVPISRVIYHDNNASYGNKTIDWQKGNLDLNHHILANASFYKLDNEDNKIIKDHILSILEDFKYTISNQGLKCMLTEGRKLREENGVKFTIKDWFRAIYRSFNKR